MILVVLIGGISLLVRGRRTPPPTPKAEEAAPAEPAPTPPRKTLPEEHQLARRIGELERAVYALSETLELVHGSEEDDSESLMILSRSEVRGEALLPQIIDMRRRGLSGSDIARRLNLSEEQLRLLLNVAARPHPNEAVGA